MYQVCDRHGGTLKVRIHLLLPLEGVGKFICSNSEALMGTINFMNTTKQNDLEQ